MRDDPDRVPLGARLDRDDVRHARGQAEVGPPRVRLLHTDVVAVEAELVDNVAPRARVLWRADRAAADRPREHLHVRAGVVE